MGRAIPNPACSVNSDRRCLNVVDRFRTRVRKGLFSPDSIPKLVENYRAGDGAIDQSDLSRLLIEVMSPETCRKTTVVLTDRRQRSRGDNLPRAEPVQWQGTVGPNGSGQGGPNTEFLTLPLQSNRDRTMNRQYKRLARTTAWMLSAALVQTASAGIDLDELATRIDSVERTTQAGTVVAYAGAPGGLVSDGVRNSRYAEALLRYLDAPLDVGSMLRWVRDSVLESTSGTQEPVAHVSLPGRSVYLAANPASRPSEYPPAEETVRRADSRRVALTIGNAAYEHVEPLRTPLNNAVAISSSLERLGFSVTRLADTDKAALETGLRVFRAQAANAEIAVV